MRVTQTLGTILFAAALLISSPGCGRFFGSSPTPAPTPTAKKEVSRASRIDAAPQGIPVKAKAVMSATWGGKKLDGDVHEAVLEAARDQGEAASLGFCNDRKVASEILKLKGVRTGRSSLRLRNPENAGPEWVQEFLRKEGEKTEVDLKSITEIVAVDGGEVAHFIRRIPVQKGCLGCHGAVAGMDKTVLGLIAEKYPADKAVGYSEGDLRGIVWAEMPVEMAPTPLEKAPTP